MKFVPLLRCTDMARAVKFYTEVLDFDMAPYDTLGSPVIDLLRHGAKMQLCEFDGTPGIAITVEVHEVDDLFRSYIERGLDTSAKLNSPVHQAPIDQTWGFREFYVTDPDGNTLRFRKVSN
jgi:catechol 2,3-dioxygenase-like lactoylglutathione lyase family enzyme